MKLDKPKITDNLTASSDIYPFIKEAKKNDRDISTVIFSDLYLDSEDMSYLSFVNCVFVNCRFQECDFEKTSFVDVRFEKCDFSNSSMYESYFKRCEFISNKLLGITLTDGILNDIAFRACNLSYSVFSKVKFSAIHSQSCDFSSSEFSYCSIRGFYPDGSRFFSTGFFETSLAGIDFSSSEVSGIHISDTFRELRGAVFNSSQAVELATLLGIKIV